MIQLWNEFSLDPYFLFENLLAKNHFNEIRDRAVHEKGSKTSP